MPEAIADARMTAPVGSSVTFQHTTMDVQQPWPSLSADDLTFAIACKPQAPQGSRWRDFWRRHLQQNKALRQMASGEESFLHTRSSR